MLQKWSENSEIADDICLDFDQTVPVDCVVSQGRSTVTIEHLTGELKPIERAVGDSIPGGARNLDGMLIVKVLISALCSPFLFL